MNQKVSEVLFLLAKRERKKRQQYHFIKRWFGYNQGSAQRRYVCYICNAVIDTESSRYPITKHTTHAIEEHGLNHLKSNGLLAFI